MAEKSGIFLKGNALEIISKELFSNDAVELLLEAAANAIIVSLQEGYVKGKDPEGNTWPENPEWWQRIKKHVNPNIGILSGGDIGPFQAHVRHMRDSMRKKINIGKKEAVIFFEEEARQRAFITHYGSDEVQKRPHFDFSTWGRHPSGQTDEEVVSEIFETIVKLRLNNMKFEV